MSTAERVFNLYDVHLLEVCSTIGNSRTVSYLMIAIDLRLLRVCVELLNMDMCGILQINKF